MKKKSLLVIILLFTAIILAAVFLRGDYLQGLIKRMDVRESFTQEDRVDLISDKKRTDNFILQKDIRSPKESPIAQNLLRRNYSRIDIMREWAPKEYREISDKLLVRLYPFPITNRYVSDETLTEHLKPEWKNIGPRGTGVTPSVDYWKKDYNHLLLGTEGSGLYKSDNFGNSWGKIDNFPFNNINRVAIDPNDSKHYLVLANQVHLYESKDEGNSWDNIYIFDESAVNRSDLIWNQDVIFVRANERIIISENNGDTWSDEYFTIFDHLSYVRIKPTGFGIARLLDNNTFEESVAITDDYGKTWQDILTEEELGGTISAYYISDDGEDIYVLGYERVNRTVILAESSNNGGLWSYTELEQLTFWPQDILVDEKDHDHIAIFIYMGGLYESFDGGNSFIKVNDEAEAYDIPQIKVIDSQDEYHLLMPLDLKFGHMVEIDISPVSINNFQDKYIQRIQLPEYEILEKESFMIDDLNYFKKLPDQEKTIYLMPTDQGLFAYDNSSKELKNIAKNLYLADTGRVTVVPSCPRIYAGWWHVGNFMIDANNKIQGQNWGEEYGAAIGKDELCKTDVMFNGSGYYEDGTNSNDFELFSLIEKLDFSFHPTSNDIGFFHSGWWYLIGWNNSTEKDTIVRFDLEDDIPEELNLPDSINSIADFYIEDSKDGVKYWLLDRDKILWLSDNLENWEIFKDLSEFTDPIFEDHYSLILQGTVTAVYGARMADSGHIDLQVNENKIWISGDGLFISNDNASTFNVFFPYSAVSNVVSDDLGRLFVGVTSSTVGQNFIQDDEMTGVYYSEDDGNSWDLLEEDTKKSLITGLAINNNTNTLYASTVGESLIMYDLSKYF